MKSLSQAEYGEIRDLYQSIYAPKQVDEEIEISDEELTEIIEETVIELLEEGYTAEEIEESFDDEFVDEILIEAKVTFGRDTPAMRKSGDLVGARREKAKQAVKTAAKGAAAEAGRRAGNVAVRAKAGATRAAMAATGVKATDVPTKSGKARKNASTFVAGRKSDRDSAKKVMGDKIKSKLGSLGSKVRGAVASAQMKKSDPDKSIKSRIGKARSGLKGLIRRGAEKVAAKASGVAKRMSEEVETYDVVVEFLCDQGIAEDLQEAQWMMVNEVDSEDIATILEAYGLDEAKGTILSVKGGGKTKYAASSKDQRAAAKSAAQRSNAALRKKSGKNIANDARAEQARKKSIEAMNSKPGEESGDYDTGYYGDDDLSGGKRHYSYGRTNRAARARRASGR